MNENKETPFKPDSLPDIPADLMKDIPASADESTEFSKFRTRLSEHRTHLSEHRTDLSEERTGMSEHRTSLSDARSHMANERTHLAQTRTAISLMTFGITLNRFSIYLQEAERMPSDTGRIATTLYDVEYVGIGMLLLGMMILVWSLFRYRTVKREIETLSYSTPDRALTAITILIILMGVGSALWMIAG